MVSIPIGRLGRERERTDHSVELNTAHSFQTFDIQPALELGGDTVRLVLSAVGSCRRGGGWEVGGDEGGEGGGGGHCGVGWMEQGKSIFFFSSPWSRKPL